jgi:hypothetical protein
VATGIIAPGPLSWRMHYEDNGLAMIAEARGD